MTPLLPPVLAVEDRPGDGRPCACLCAVRHPDQSHVCEGTLRRPGATLVFESQWPDGGRVAVCATCADLLREQLPK